MARTVNKVILLGRLGADPDVRYLQDGTPVANFSLATNEPFRGSDGNWEERTEWHRVAAFQRLAEVCANYLSKGGQVYVEGKLRTRQWEDAQGVKRYSTEIVARELVLLGGRGDQTGEFQTNQPGYKSNYGGGKQSRQQPAGEPSSPQSLPEMATPPPDDDIPF